MPQISPAPSMLERLKKQRAVIDARIQATEARSNHAKRKQDTRRKILIGSYFLDKAIKENKLDEIKKLMDNYLSRDSDRKLFELVLKKDNSKIIILKFQ